MVQRTSPFGRHENYYQLLGEASIAILASKAADVEGLVHGLHAASITLPCSPQILVADLVFSTGTYNR